MVGVAAGLTRGAQTGHPVHELGRLVVAGLALAPAAWLLAGRCAPCCSACCRARAALAWAVYGLAVVLGPLGAALDLPVGVQDLSPYTHLPQLPAASVPASDLAGLVGLTALAVARRRGRPARLPPPRHPRLALRVAGTAVGQRRTVSNRASASARSTAWSTIRSG